MNKTKGRQWFQARLKWAVMQEGQGLIQWRRSEHILLSESREAAVQELMRIGYAEQHCLIPDDDDLPAMDMRFAEIEYLEEPRMGRTTFDVYLGEIRATESIGFDHEFHPEGQTPGPVF